MYVLINNYIIIKFFSTNRTRIWYFSPFINIFYELLDYNHNHWYH